jgi:signal peptidase I
MPASPFEIPWINIAFYLVGENWNNTDSAWWDYHRLKGLSGLSRNQIVVFNKPNNPKEIFIKRCMGLPGDTICIKNTQVYANGRKIPERNTVKFMYRVLFNNYTRASSLLDSLDLNWYYNRHNDTGFVSLPLSISGKQNLLQHSCIDSVTIEKIRPDTAWTTFPHHDLFHWTIDDFGPLVIPRKGMTISLDEKNYALYRFIINNFEKDTISRNNKAFYINGEQVSVYTFKYDYYFMLGDNRHDSNDSRYWGFVPEQCIIGKAVLVLFSGGEGGFRRERVLRVIR